MQDSTGENVSVNVNIYLRGNTDEQCNRAVATAASLFPLHWSEGYEKDGGLRECQGTRPTRSASSVNPRRPGSEPASEPSITLPDKLPRP